MPITFEEALMTLHGAGPILDIAREITVVLRDEEIQGAVIGGVAVALHGYLRTTIDVDVVVLADAERFAEALKARGFEYRDAEKEFVKRSVPVHIVTTVQTVYAPKRVEQIDGIQTVSLADLINMKLRSGLQNILRAKDMGDVIGLIRHHRLTKDFTPQIDKEMRDEYRTLIDAIERERKGG